MESPCDCMRCSKNNNIGFIATRIAGTDGVTLETLKWARVFENDGYNCFYFAGELETPAEQSYLSKKSHFTHHEIVDIYRKSFDARHRSRSTTLKIMTLKEEIKDELYDFINRFRINLLVAENAVTIPLNIPLGLAITEVVSETGIIMIAHHHDFYWERSRFMTNAIWEYLGMAFPPHLPRIHHVVISSAGDSQLGFRKGTSSTTIPNVMDFENPPSPPDDYTSDVRETFGIAEDEYFILQPTRVIKRKGIEHAIELVSRLGLKAKLIISHASGDEGHSYERRIQEYSAMLNVETVFVSKLINEKRGRTKNGRKIYTLNDIYPHADLITYPSSFEGFGNAFLEALYFKKPIVVNSYSIYSTDIKPKGFDVIEIDGYVDKSAIAKTRKVLRDPVYRQHMTEHNFETAKRFYSYTVLTQKLRGVMTEISPCAIYQNGNEYKCSGKSS
ncbi:MAG: glycosyltransferase family 4 protein [Desulfosalsimonadaceae bacterium]